MSRLAVSPRMPTQWTGMLARCSAGTHAPRATVGVMLALGMLLAPCAEATLAPDQADSYISSAPAGDKTKNFGKDQVLKIGPTTSALIRFDLATIPSTNPDDVEKGNSAPLGQQGRRGGHDQRAAGHLIVE